MMTPRSCGYGPTVSSADRRVVAPLGYHPAPVTRLGIIGLPNVGKTTLFNALTGLDAVVAPHAFSTTEPNLGVAPVPDRVLERASIVEGSAKTVFATLDLLDLPALGEGGGLGARVPGQGP